MGPYTLKGQGAQAVSTEILKRKAPQLHNAHGSKTFSLGLAFRV